MDLNLDSLQEAEMSVIGAIILEEKSLAKVVDKISAQDFYFDDLKCVYKAILKLSNAGKPIDYITVLNEVVAENPECKDEMKVILLRCAEILPHISNIEYYADIVSKSSMVRKLKNLSLEMYSDGITTENVLETSEKLVSKVSEIIIGSKKRKLESISDVALNLLKNYGENGANQENRCDTGFSKLDGILKGMSAGNLVILAARPKVGKTSFALQIAGNVAKTGKKVAFYSQEMLKAELCERLIAEKSFVSMDTLIDKKFEVNKISKAVEEMKKYPIFINDSPSISAGDIRLECRMIKNLGLIVVDYIQLMKPTRKAENRNQEIGQISRDLKCLANDLNVPILCLSQLNRMSDESKRPSASELRDSGSIEQDANKVILMWCVEKHLNEFGVVESKTIGVDVALNRRGSTGVTLMNFNGKYMKFTELERRYEEREETELKNWRNKFN